MAGTSGHDCTSARVVTVAAISLKHRLDTQDAQEDATLAKRLPQGTFLTAQFTLFTPQPTGGSAPALLELLTCPLGRDVIRLQCTKEGRGWVGVPILGHMLG